MTWISYLWPMATGACITMGLISIGVGLQKRFEVQRLLFATTAFLFAAFSYMELSMALATSPARFLELQRWMDFVGAAGIISLAAFVWKLFGTGRKTLAVLGSVLLCASLTFNLFPEPKLVFLDFTGIKTIETFGGATYTIGEGTRNPWVGLFYAGVLLITAFVADASVAVWRNAQNRRAALLGGCITFFLVFGGLQTFMVDAEIVATPYFVSFYYLVILVAMGIELVAEVSRASQLAQDLDENEKRLGIAAATAHLGLWAWNVSTDEIWSTSKNMELLGLPPKEQLDNNRFISIVHPNGDQVTGQSIASRINTDTDYERVRETVLPNGKRQWIAIRGIIERDEAGRPVKVRGVSIDISQLKEAEDAARNANRLLVQVMEDERARIARELHDDLSQGLSLLAIQMDMACHDSSASSGIATEQIEAFSARVKNFVSKVYRLSYKLHPAKLEQLGLEAALRSYCQELSSTGDIKIEFETLGVSRELPNEIALCVYRIAQEGLHNFVKHSGTNHASVTIMATDGEVSLVVSDQGCGFDLSAQARGGSLGIASMYERAQLAGGTISVQSCKGEGTQIVLLIPLSHDGEKPIANLVTSNPFIVTATTFQNTSERE